MADAKTIPTIKQGDAGWLGVTVTLNEETITAADLPLLHCVEFMIGDGIRKLWPDEATFADGKFHVPYTQAETFALEDGDTIRVDTRVHFETNGAPEQVVGVTVMGKIKIADAISEEVLT